jgi:integrase
MADDEREQDATLPNDLRKSKSQGEDSGEHEGNSHATAPRGRLDMTMRRIKRYQEDDTPLFNPDVAMENWKISVDQPPIEPNQDARLNSFKFSKAELDRYVAHRKEGLAPKSQDWIDRASQALWDCTHGEISQTNMEALRTFVLWKYSSIDSHRKAVGFAVAFLNRLSKTRGNPRIKSFEVYLELPKAVRARKTMTGRVIRREDIAEVFKRIAGAMTEATLTESKARKYRNYRAFALLASYTGLRPSTIQRLTVGQVKTALKEDKPALHVLPEQEKNRVEHFVPLHPKVVEALKEVLTNDFGKKGDTEAFFMYNSFENWLERQRIPLPAGLDPTEAHLWLKDFRKFAATFADVINWQENNRRIVMAHDLKGVSWSSYKAPQREDVYDKYMEAWKDIDLTAAQPKKPTKKGV